LKLDFTKKNRILGKICGFLFVFALLGVLVGKTYAWLATYYESEEVVAFDTEETNPIPVHMWIYNTVKERDQGWKKYTATVNSQNSEEAVLPSILVQNTAGSTYKYTLKSMHLGSVDNLVTLSDDQIVYCRFDISTQEHGTLIQLDITQPTNSISGYGRTGQALPTDVIDALNELDADNPHLIYSYAYSNKAYEPGQNGFDQLTFQSQDWTEDDVKNKYHLAMDIGQADDRSSENYYLYLRITPDLHTLGRDAIILRANMPCQLLFDWDWELTVHPFVD